MEEEEDRCPLWVGMYVAAIGVLMYGFFTNSNDRPSIRGPIFLVALLVIIVFYFFT